MSALVRMGRRAAILRAGQWIAAERELEEALNAHTLAWFQQGKAPKPGRDQELAVAQEMARQFGGKVVTHVRTKRNAADKHFLRQRQLGFDF